MPVFSFHTVLLFLITNMVFFYLIDLWYVSLAQHGGAFYNDGGDLTFEGSATFTSCSVVVSSSSSDSDTYTNAVSGGELLSVVEEAQPT